MTTTTDLSKFGYMELKSLEILLTAMREQGLPEDFDNDEVVPMMNQHSGNVFLTNANYEVAMLINGKLESFYNCPECGHEGFGEDFKLDDDCEGCQEIAKRGVI